MSMRLFAPPLRCRRRVVDRRQAAGVRAGSHWRAWSLAAWLACAAFPAHAALWGYVDAAGVAHFAGSAVDRRFQLVLSDDARRQPAARRVPGKADGAVGLLTWLEIAPEVRAVRPLLRAAARETGVDAELLTAVIAVESAFNTRVVSPRGAIGLMQITADTADRYASRAERQLPAATRLLDARTNIDTGARMLADLLRRHHQQTHIALAAWNAGEGAVRRHGGRVPPIDETEAHVHLVMELYWALLQRSLTRGITAMKLQ